MRRHVGFGSPRDPKLDRFAATAGTFATETINRFAESLAPCPKTRWSRPISLNVDRFLNVLATPRPLVPISTRVNQNSHATVLASSTNYCYREQSNTFPKDAILDFRPLSTPKPERAASRFLFASRFSLLLRRIHRPLNTCKHVNHPPIPSVFRRTSTQVLKSHPHTSFCSKFVPPIRRVAERFVATSPQIVVNGAPTTT